MPEIRLPLYGSDLLVTKPATSFSEMLRTPYPWQVDKPKGSDNGKPITPAQVEYIGESFPGMLSHNASFRFNQHNRRFVDFSKMRAMRRDPTIALAREVAVAPIVGSSWTIEVDNDAPEDLKLYCEKYLLPLRKRFLRTALFGEIDFGWRAYEKILNTVRDKALGVLVVPERLKSLYNDTTWVKYNEEGDYDGLLHQDPNGYGWVWIDRAYSVFANFDDDGLGYYNDPRLIRAEAAYDEWNAISTVSKRYNEKIAGAVWVIHFPEGKTWYKGLYQDNSVIARDIIYSIKASGYLMLPSKLLADAQTELEQLGQGGWRIELLESSSKQADFIAGMEYQDKLKIRALGVLERAVTEGQYGTKAEAESHVNVMLLNMQLRHEDLTELFNYEIVDHLSELNFAAPGAVRFIAQPLTDERYDLFQSLFTAMISDPSSGPEILEKLDTDEILNHLRIPMMTAEQIAQRDAGTTSLFQILQSALNGTAQPAADGITV